jgi:hypothetical protein
MYQLSSLQKLHSERPSEVEVLLDRQRPQDTERINSQAQNISNVSKEKSVEDTDVPPRYWK